MDTKGEQINNFTIQPTFTGFNCREGSRLVWIPTPYDEMTLENRFGRLSCVDKNEEAHSFCVTLRPDDSPSGKYIYCGNQIMFLFSIFSA